LIRFLLNILLLMLIIGLIRPVLRGAQSTLKRVFTPDPPPRPAGKGKADHQDLSPYEIEDAEYEEIKNDRD
jgi:hypothetical protein